jgi:hypothetical protein
MVLEKGWAQFYSLANVFGEIFCLRIHRLNSSSDPHLLFLQAVELAGKIHGLQFTVQYANESK